MQVVLAEVKCFGAFSKGIVSLFVGVDEYQKIPYGPNFNEKKFLEGDKDERENTFLWGLLDLFVSNRFVQHEEMTLHLYAGFAGTKWGRLSIDGSSVAHVLRAPLQLLHPERMWELVAKKYPEKVKDASFQRDLFFFGGLPRPSLVYASSNKGFEQVWMDEISNKWSSIPTSVLLPLIAPALSCHFTCQVILVCWENFE